MTPPTRTEPEGGWVLVPREPTEAMLEASWSRTVAATPEERMASELGDAKAAHIAKAARRYRAMIAAAPPATPVQGDRVAGERSEPASGVDVAGLIQRLRKYGGPSLPEDIMADWDGIRTLLLDGCLGSEPRDRFENLLFAMADDMEEAADALARLSAEVDEGIADGNSLRDRTIERTVRAQAAEARADRAEALLEEARLFAEGIANDRHDRVSGGIKLAARNLLAKLQDPQGGGKT